MSTRIVAIAVGNTRTRFGLFEEGDLSTVSSLPSGDALGLRDAILALASDLQGVPMVMATVNKPASTALAKALSGTGHDSVLRINEDIIIPMKHTLDEAETVGEDRLLCAFAAYRRARQACIVIDAGTAITVDFVDGEGAFHGGVIAPGLHVMLAAMHEHTAALPKLEYHAPDPSRGPFGKDTAHAMMLGVRGAAVGLVHYMIDVYAEHYEAYPQVIATGGDAAALFEGDELVEHLVPDLQLVGILESCKAHDEELSGEGGETENGR